MLTAESGSGTSNSNTASTTDNSSRLSATSTAPSSTDASKDTKGDEWRSPHDMPFRNIPLPPAPKSSPGFSLKASGRTFSFGRNKNANTPTTPPPVPPKGSRTPPEEEYEAGRARAVTASSYASTATPPKLDERDFSMNLGGNFSDMFSTIGKRKSQMLDSESRGPELRSPVRHAVTQNRDAKLTPSQNPPQQAVRSFSSSHSNQPSPLNIDRKPVEPSPYSWSSQNSHDGLMQSPTPPPLSPGHGDRPPVPQHQSSGSNSNNSTSRPPRPGGVADSGLRRNSGHNGRRKSGAGLNKSVDLDAKLLRDAAYASQRLNAPDNGPKVRDSWALPSNLQYNPDEAAVSGFLNEGSEHSTPKAKRTELHDRDDVLFDNVIAESASIAQQFQEISTPSPPSKLMPRNKVMTPAQFERYKKDQEKLASYGGRSKDEKEAEEEEEDNYDDEDDEAEKNKKLASQRRRQEAHMSVYRQQMMKVTGEVPSTLGRPVVTGTQSSPNLGTVGQPEDKEEEDEEVPLAILQAHGFPNKNKPPMHSMRSIPNLRAQSAMGGALPVFARNLPQDPYVGAGLAYPTNRESMGFGGGAASVHGGSARGVPVGGLVGVIASEERSRAMRRGSPNHMGEYGPPPANGFDGMGGMSPSLRASTMMGPMGPINPMMLSPGDQAQLQMSQQMQQFMQMQMQFMQLMTSGQAPSPGQNPGQPLGDFPQPQGRPGSSHQGRPGSSHQRAQTMMDPASASWLPQTGPFAPSVRGQGGYAPSIAPSERSNVGMPGRYRPVSQMPVSDNKSQATSMEGALQGWDNKTRASTIKMVPKASTASDDDDDQGWEEMAKKRATKRSLWRTKKENNELKEMLNYT
jgi:hypothetical protein